MVFKRGSQLYSRYSQVHNSIFCKPKHIHKLTDCGRARNAKKLVKSGEVTSEPGRWPWHVAVYWKSGEGAWEYVCGGSLISKNAVITAAHCVTTPLSETPVTYENITVQSGKYWRQYNRTDEFAQTREVAHVIVHPNYSGTTFDSDAALLILKSPVKFTSRVSPVCYPTIGNTLLEEYQLQSGNIGTVRQLLNNALAAKNFSISANNCTKYLRHCLVSGHRMGSHGNWKPIGQSP